MMDTQIVLEQFARKILPIQQMMERVLKLVVIKHTFNKEISVE
jgi:hypothetical protein